MIFFDESGKRWRAIKRSAAGTATLFGLPVALLVGGALVYQPSWTAFQFPGLANKTSTRTAQNQPAAQKKPSTKSTTIASGVRSALESQSSVVTPSLTQQVATNSPTSTTQPTTSGTTTTTPTTTTSPPGNSGYGHTHNTIH